MRIKGRPPAQCGARRLRNNPPRPHGEGMVSVDQKSRLRYPRRTTVTIIGPLRLRPGQSEANVTTRRLYRREQWAMHSRAALDESVVVVDV
jgi:hypothetical protein